MEYIDRIEKPCRDHRSRRVKRGKLVLEDRLDWRSLQFLPQIAIRSVCRRLRGGGAS